MLNARECTFLPTQNQTQNIYCQWPFTNKYIHRIWPFTNKYIHRIWPVTNKSKEVLNKITKYKYITNIHTPKDNFKQFFVYNISKCIQL